MLSRIYYTHITWVYLSAIYELTIKTGSLQHFRLADIDIMERVDTLACLFNFFADAFRNKLVDQILEITSRTFAGHNFYHLAADLADLSRLGVRAFANLVGALLGKANAEKTESVTISRLYIRKGFDERLPFLYQAV